jgi:hypothetical protein
MNNKRKMKKKKASAQQRKSTRDSCPEYTKNPKYETRIIQSINGQMNRHFKRSVTGGSDRDRAPNLSGSKFIKQAGRTCVQRLSPKNKGGFPYLHLEHTTEMGGWVQRIPY